MPGPPAVEAWASFATVVNSRTSTSSWGTSRTSTRLTYSRRARCGQRQSFRASFLMPDGKTIVSGDLVTPVVVLVTHHHVGLGIARSLGRLGVPVYGIDRDRFSPMFYSRFCRGRFIWDVHHEPVEATLAFLKRVADMIGRRALLIPTSDVGAMLVAEHAERLAGEYIFPRQPAGLVKSLCSKRELYYLAKQCAIPTPEAAFPASRADVLDYVSRVRFPILVKPIYNFVPGLKPWRMILVYAPEELMACYDSMDNQSSQNVMLQEYIPGGDEMTWTFNGYFDARGDCL